MILIPTVSIGNVPQLAADLLIYTYGFKLLEILNAEDLCPIVGPLDYVDEPNDFTPRKGVSTPCQLYGLEDNYIVHVRSPPVTNHKKLFLQNLKDQLPSGPVLIIGSANQGMRSSDAKTSDILHIAAQDCDKAKALMETGYLSQGLECFKCPAIVLCTYEGDNRQDAHTLAREVAAKMNLPEKNLVEPVSWKKLYGSSPPLRVEDGIYV